jgi:hypothetical protein
MLDGASNKNDQQIFVTFCWFAQIFNSNEIQPKYGEKSTPILESTPP